MSLRDFRKEYQDFVLRYVLPLMGPAAEEPPTHRHLGAENEFNRGASGCYI